MNLRTVNKRVMESMVFGGAFDCFESAEMHRATFFAPTEKHDSFIENLLKYGTGHQDNKMTTANSLFGDLVDSGVNIPEPILPKVEPWNLLTKLKNEKDVVGIYISGHPLDDFKLEVENFTTCSLDRVETFKNQKVKVAGFVSSARHRISQKGTGYGTFMLQDFNGGLEIPMFSEDYAKWKHLFIEGESLYVIGSMKQRYNSEEFQFKVEDVKMLSSIAGTLAESVTINIPLELLDEKMLNEIDRISKEHKGRNTLKFRVIDNVNAQSIAMSSGGRKVNADNDFIFALGRLGLDCKVN
jgi:DNA polymerase III subunit alpha